MKHLKLYKIFDWQYQSNESSMYGKVRIISELQYSDVAELKLELEDALIDLRDDGFNTEVKFRKDYKMYLYITFLDYQSKTASLDEIKDYIERVNKMADKFEPVGIYYKIMQPDGRVFNRSDKEHVNWSDIDIIIDSLGKEVVPKTATPLRSYYPGLEKKLCFFAIEYIERE